MEAVLEASVEVVAAAAEPVAVQVESGWRKLPPPRRRLAALCLQFLLAGAAFGMSWGILPASPVLAMGSLVIGLFALFVAAPTFKALRAKLPE